MLESFDEDRLRSAEPYTVSDLLEQGKIVHFPRCPVPLASEADLERLRRDLAGQLKRKNASYHPESDRVTGLQPGAPLAGLAYDVLTRHRQAVSDFLSGIMPKLMPDATIGTCSFRPVEEQGRNLSAHASSELIHIDAGAYGATNGDRILRFFVNVNPDTDRVWATKGSFAEVFERYGSKAGLAAATGNARYLERGLLDRARTAALHGVSHLLPAATILDSSPYDRAMRKFHNYMKDTPEFRNDPAGYQEIRFAPGSAWMAFADGVSHACISGRHALIWTCLVPLKNSHLPELAPINILRRAA